MRRKLVVPGLFLLCLIILSGCTFARQRFNVQNFHEKMELVVPGETKADDLSGIFGTPPNAILPLNKGNTIHLYSFGQGKTAGLNLFIINIQKTNMGFDSGYFYVDENGIVKEKAVSTNSKDIPWQWWAFGD